MGSPRKTGTTKKYVTIRDIALEAGVSANSVSRALHDKKDISQETKIRVRNIAKELGYIRHAAASGLRSGGTRSIGIIVTHIDNIFFSGILQGINDRVTEKEYTLLMLASNEDPETERRNLRILAAYRVSGILFIPASDLLESIDYGSIQAPHIEIVRHVPGSRAGYYVSDSVKSGELAAGYLIGKGRRRLAYLGFDKPVSCNRDRLDGFKHAAASAGIDISPAAVRSCEASTEAAFSAMKRWLDDGFDHDGIFVYNDVMAFGVIRALVDRKRRVPRDVSVVGHDDIETAESFIPRLSTIQVPKYRLGYDSASALLDQIESRKAGSIPAHMVYQPELMIRET
jgi:LacI family transcriptional regulator